MYILTFNAHFIEPNINTISYWHHVPFIRRKSDVGRTHLMSLWCRFWNFSWRQRVHSCTRVNALRRTLKKKCHKGVLPCPRLFLIFFGCSKTHYKHFFLVVICSRGSRQAIFSCSILRFWQKNFDQSVLTFRILRIK